MTLRCEECKTEVTYHVGTTFCKECAAEFYAVESTENNEEE